MRYWIFWEWQKCTTLSSAATLYGGRHMGPLQVMVLPMEVISGPIWRSALKIYVMLNQRKIVYFFSKINRGELKGLHGWSIILDAAKIFQSQVHSLTENFISDIKSVNNSFEIYLVSNLSALARSSSFHGVPQLKLTQWIKQSKAMPSFVS